MVGKESNEVSEGSERGKRKRREERSRRVWLKRRGKEKGAFVGEGEEER